MEHQQPQHEIWQCKLNKEEADELIFIYRENLALRTKLDAERNEILREKNRIIERNFQQWIQEIHSIQKILSQTVESERPTSKFKEGIEAFDNRIQMEEQIFKQLCQKGIKKMYAVLRDRPQ